MTMTRDRIRRYESHGYRHGHYIRSLPAQFYLLMQNAFSAHKDVACAPNRASALLSSSANRRTRSPPRGNPDAFPRPPFVPMVQKNHFPLSFTSLCKMLFLHHGQCFLNSSLRSTFFLFLCT